MTDEQSITRLERIRHRVATEVSVHAAEHSWPGIARILIAELDRLTAQLGLQRDEIERRRAITIQLRRELVEAQQATQAPAAEPADAVDAVDAPADTKTTNRRRPSTPAKEQAT